MYKNSQNYLLFNRNEEKNRISRDLFHIGQSDLYKTKLPRRRKNNQILSEIVSFIDKREEKQIQRIWVRVSSSSSLRSNSCLCPVPCSYSYSCSYRYQSSSCSSSLNVHGSLFVSFVSFVSRVSSRILPFASLESFV